MVNINTFYDSEDEDDDDDDEYYYDSSNTNINEDNSI